MTAVLKTKIGSVLIVILFIVSSASNSFSQRFQGDLHFSIANPLGEFSDNIENKGFGVSGNFLVRVQDSPLSLGVGAGFINYGRVSRREPFSYTIPDVSVKVTNTNNIALFNLLFAVEPRRGVFRPYAGGQWGINYLFTRTTINDVDGIDDEIASTTNFDDAAFSYGAFTGVKFKVWETSEYNVKADGFYQVFLDFRVSYLAGREAEYLKEGSIRRFTNNVAFDVNRSRTNIALFRIGVSVAF